MCPQPEFNFTVTILKSCFIFLTFFLRSCVFLWSCSPCSGEGEGLHSAPGQLLFVWQQPVHQSQRQRRVGVRRRLRLKLRVGGGGAAQQEEAACGGQLESWAVKTWSGQRDIREGERERSLQSSQGSLAPPPLYNNNHHPGLPHHPLHLWLRLMTPQISTHHHHKRLSSHPISKNRREEVSRVEDTASVHLKSFRFFSPSHPCLSLSSLILRHWSFPSSNVNNSKPKKRQLGNLRTLCFFIPPVNPSCSPGMFLGRRRRGGHARRTPPSTAILHILCFFFCLFCYSW